MHSGSEAEFKDLFIQLDLVNVHVVGFDYVVCVKLMGGKLNLEGVRAWKQIRLKDIPASVFHHFTSFHLYSSPSSSPTNIWASVHLCYLIHRSMITMG